MAGIRMENMVFDVGVYCRLSKDDGTDNESASIATQKSILTDYVKKQGWHLAKTYVDDGYSGTNFQRPSFQNMIKDIENGLINCVVTKDLSRLGRNYLDCGLYLEVFFPEHNVRYIAVNDGVDTLNKSAKDITPFRNILNEMYSADVSVKIKSAYRAWFNQGKFMGTTAPYGYVKDPTDHNHMLSVEMLANFGDSIARKCKVEYLPYHMGNLVIYQQMVMVGGVFDIAIRGCRTHKLPLVEPRTVRRFYLDRHISGIHLVKDIAEWGKGDIRPCTCGQWNLQNSQASQQTAYPTSRRLCGGARCNRL